MKESATASSDEITAFCKNNLSNYKVPAEMEIVDELPKSVNKKILKHVLRDLAAEKEDG